MLDNAEIWDQTQDRLPDWASNIILAGYRGSQSHGTSIYEGPNATDDIDVFGISVQPTDWYLGLEPYSPRKRQVFDTAGEELDILIYDIRKLFSLLVKGNPNVHVYLWLKPEHRLRLTLVGGRIMQARRHFISKRVLTAIHGYAESQFTKMQRDVYRGYMGKRRKALTDKYHYDIKHASHCIRLMYLGIQLLRDGTLNAHRPE